MISPSHISPSDSTVPPQRPDHLLGAGLARGVFACLLFGFVLSVALGLHRSSLGQWGKYLGVGADSDVILGESRPIRSDEWLVGLAWTLAQLNAAKPLQKENLSIGGGRAALFSGVPTYHWSAIFRPSLWGYFFLPAERGLSWHWAFATWGTLAALFSIFLVLSRGEVLVSIAGTAWLFFSPFTQWWFSTPYVNILFGGSLAVTAAISCVHGSTALRRWVASGIFVWSATVFALSLYPPFLIPVAIVSFAAFVSGVFLWRIPRSFGEVFVRFGSIFVGASIALLLVLRFFSETSDALTAIQNTAYPGSRTVFGGAFSSIRTWSGLYGPWLTETRLLVGTSNICEASSFILLWPLVLICFFDRRLRIVTLPLLPILLACILFISWISHGLPLQFAKMLGLTLVPEVRAQAGLGFASILVTTLLLARVASLYSASCTPRPGLTGLLGYGLPIGAGLATAWLGFTLGQGRVTTDLPTWTIILQSTAIAVFSASITLGARRLFAVAVLLLVVIPGFLVNPISRGLGGLESSALLKTAKQIGAREPNARWLAFSDNLAPNLLMMAGVKVLNGMKLTPLNHEFGIFDEGGTAKPIYNRLAQAVLHPNRKGVTGPFKLVQTDMWSLEVSPCDPRLKDIGVDYFVFLRRADRDSQLCLTALNDSPLDGRFWLARRTGP